MKKYVDIKANKNPEWLLKHFKVGDTVVIVDGSYMVKKTDRDSVNGNDFIKDGLHELLTVKRINIPFRTDCKGMNSLVHHNNCELETGDGNFYYASKINMVRFNDGFPY